MAFAPRIMASGLSHILILLGAAVSMAILFHRVRLPTILGYLCVGVLVGPYGAGWIPNAEDVRALAEFGVVLLLFTIGLEFSLPRLTQFRPAVLVLGGSQVLLTAAITAGIGYLLGMTTEGALVVGGVVAMSSTAIVIKQLTDQFELVSLHGRNAVGILLIQDVAVVPMLILVASFTTAETASFWVTLLWALVKGVAALAAIFVIGQWVLRPLFHIVSKSRSMELFTLSALLVSLGCAWITHAMGLSLALGAFVAGVLLGETEFRHQLESNIAPFRDVLLGLFFITIGMLLNVPMLPAVWSWVILLLAALLVFKTLLIAVLSRLAGFGSTDALRTGLVLAQGGEFGFAILSIALEGRLLPADYGQVVLAALFFSMALAPVMIRHSGRIAAAVFPRSARVDHMQVREAVGDIGRELTQHVIICGFGRVGQNIVRFLGQEGIPFIAVDMDPVRVQNARLAGDNVSFGDATHLDILSAAGLHRARVLVVTIDDASAALKILQQVRRAAPDLPVLVRTRDHADFERLHQAGASAVIPETLEASLALASRLLDIMEIPPSQIERNIHAARTDRYRLLRRLFPAEGQETLDGPHGGPEHLRSVTVRAGSCADGVSVSELDLERFSVTLTALRRGHTKYRHPPLEAWTGDRSTHPAPDARIRAGDVVVLYGMAADLKRAEKFLHRPPRVTSVSTP